MFRTDPNPTISWKPDPDPTSLKKRIRIESKPLDPTGPGSATLDTASMRKVNTGTVIYFLLKVPSGNAFRFPISNAAKKDKMSGKYEKTTFGK